VGRWSLLALRLHVAALPAPPACAPPAARDDAPAPPSAAAPPGDNAYGYLGLFPDRIEIEGHGRLTSRVLKLKQQAAAA
jgi:hypothetical protein